MIAPVNPKPINILYADLATTIGTSSLKPGAWYRITDYATVHFITDFNGVRYNTIITGATEPLVVLATSSNTLDINVHSESFPQDIIHYDWNPANWTSDLSFAKVDVDSSIVPGFKGVITFRHDTQYDNWFGYDFRNCKFRRWKIGSPAWSGATNYSKGQFVTFGGYLFQARIASLNQMPVDGSDYWNQLLNFDITQYFNPVANTFNGIASGADFADYLTFVPNGNGTYAKGVRSVHMGSLWDDYNHGLANGTILPNNVFFLNNTNDPTIQFLECQSGFAANTLVGECRRNSFGEFCIANQIDNTCDDNNVGNGFSYNIVSNTTIKNRIGDLCAHNIWVQAFQNNTIGQGFSGNNISDDFTFNTVGNGVQNNVFGHSCSQNTVGNGFANNTIDNAFIYNTIGENLQRTTVAANFRMNVVENNFNSNFSLDLSSATLVYGAYTKHLYVRPDGTQKLWYLNDSDAVVVAAANG